MSAESIIFSTLSTLVSGRVFPDVAPENTVLPYITFQRVGGSPVQFMDTAIPSKKNARFQVNVWGDNRAQVSTLAGQVEDAMRVVAALQTTVLGAPVATYEPETKLRGSMQDFSVWN